MEGMHTRESARRAAAARGEAPVTAGHLSQVAAALVRMQAHTLDSQGRALIEQSERLREEANRIEHGGDLPDLRVVEEDTEEGLVLPRIAMSAGGWAAVDTHGIPHADLGKFLGQFHERWIGHSAFGEVFNRLAAGELPTFDVAQRVTAELQESTP